MAPILLINIGNTTTQVGTSPDSVWTVPTEKGESCTKLAGRLPRGHDNWLAASVVPEAMTHWEGLAEEKGASLHWVDAGLLAGIDCTAVDISTVGADRLANIAAAAHCLPLPLIILDCGTAITTEVVDTGPRFLGGAILPGRLLARRALATFTGQLPEVDLFAEIPAAVAGTTEEAIRAGIDEGLVGSIVRLLDKSVKQAGLRDCRFYATGGDAAFFLKHLRMLSAAPPNLTMHGLSVMAEQLEARMESKA